MSRPIRWLHLSDLHLGCRGREVWWQVQEQFRRCVEDHVRGVGQPDLVLFSGDLTNTGNPDEFEQLDLFLAELQGWIRGAGDGSEPLVVPVPGNHDLKRPAGMATLAYRVLDRYSIRGDDEDVHMLDDQLWSKRDGSFLQKLFSGYQGWLETSILPGLRKRATDVRTSHIPGDLFVRVEVADAFPLCIVGLNSTWLQYRAGDFERRLAIPVQQFQAVLGFGRTESPLSVFEGCRRSLLMLHHPPSWLSSAARQDFNEAIYLPRRFDVCLHGHLHEARSEAVVLMAGEPRYYLQAPSLFGLEHYGTRGEKRAVGFTWGQLSADGEVRIWPLIYTSSRGEMTFLHDPGFDRDPAGTRIRPFSMATEESAASTDFGPYLEDVISQTDHIKISGLSEGGEVKGAVRYPIEQLYTPLSTRYIEMHEHEERRVRLADLLPKRGRILVEGQPGAGKTTFVRFVACMLARDFQEIECPAGSTWSDRYLGSSGRGRVPVLLRAIDLVPLLAGAGAPRNRRDGHRSLLDLLDRICQENEYGISRRQWEDLLDKGRALLLFDGLDEVTDEGLRERVFEIFRDACAKWKLCDIVVTSRPIQTASLRDLGFYVATVEAFGREEIRAFIDRWVMGLHAVETTAELGNRGTRYREALERAIIDMPQVRRLATNPVMLTSLCVVHWNEGQLPEGRARVYRAVIRWLIASRQDRRVERGFTDRFSWRAFARLALAMMTARGGKRSVWDLEDAAVAVDPIVVREFPELSKEERRHRAKEWLRFECLASGVLEEIAERRIRFWHLTFQEFLAALQLAWRDDGTDAEESWWPALREHLDDAQWRETIDLFPCCLIEEGGEGRVDRLLQRVLGLRVEDAELAGDARLAGIIGRLLRPLQIYHYRPPQEVAAEYKDLLERSLAVFSIQGAEEVAEEVRISAAEALGRGGDPRLAAEVDNFLAVSLRGGWYKGKWLPEGFQLGRFPVTVEEYQRFVEGRGYEQMKMWPPEGWRRREERRWDLPEEWDIQLETPNRPVVGVSWYEAQAYCRWLGEQRSQVVRLPREDEWQQAAESAVALGSSQAPTPVGIYPSGASRHGHLDMVGNVWEWCEDAFRLPKSSEGLRAIRGCGWASFSQLADASTNWAVVSGGLASRTVTTRGKILPSSRSRSVGFRVALYSLTPENSRRIMGSLGERRALVEGPRSS